MTSKASDWDEKSEDDIRNEGPGEEFTTKPKPGQLILLSEALKHLRPTEWLIREIMERGYLYTLTAHPGAGKTAVASLLAAMISTRDVNLLPQTFDGHEVKRGRVAYLIGENADDTLKRIKALLLRYDVKSTVGFYITNEAFDLRQLDGIKEEIRRSGCFDLIIVDTGPSFFSLSGGNDENATKDMTAFASIWREMTKLDGRPTVLALSHPKAAAACRDDMVPRGAGSFLAAVDGNFSVWRSTDDILEFGWTRKLRGPGFVPVKFGGELYSHPSLADADGVVSRIFVPEIMTSGEESERAARGRASENKILAALLFARKGLTHTQLVEATRLTPATCTDARKRLMPKFVVPSDRDAAIFVLTDKGRKEAETSSTV